MNRRAERAVLSNDTAPEIELLQVSRRREVSSTEKARLMTGLGQAADALALAGAGYVLRDSLGFPWTSSRTKPPLGSSS